MKPDLEQTLEDLQLDYLDSFVIHWAQAAPATGKACATRLTGEYPAPASENTMFPVDDEGYFCSDNDCHYLETWEAMEDLVEEGLVKSIGLSNFNRRQVTEVLTKSDRKLPVSVLQCECHAYLQQKDLIDFCHLNNIAFQCYSPLGSGKTHLGVTESPSGVIPLEDPFILSLAHKYNKNPGQILLKFQLQRGLALVSKSVNEKRIANNFEIFDWNIDEADMQQFETINYGWRHLHWRETSHHPDYPFPEELPYKYQLEKAPKVTSCGVEGPTK